MTDGMRLIPASEVAARLGIHANTLKRFAKSGLLPGYKIGTRGDWRFDPRTVEEYLRRAER